MAYLIGNRASYLNETRNGVAKLNNQPDYCYNTAMGYLCGGDPFELPGGTLVYFPGIYIDTLGVIDACDVITTTTVVEGIEFEVEVDTVMCEGEYYVTGTGDLIGEPGTYVDILTSELYGCDSVVTINLNFYPSYLYTDSVTINEGESFTLPDGTLVSEEGTYTSSFETTQGCDSVFITYVDVLTGVTDQANDNDVIQVFPNPSDGQFEIIYKNTESGEIACSLYGTDGKLIWAKPFRLNSMNNSFSVEIAPPSGIYYLIIISQQSNFFKKIVIR